MNGFTKNAKLTPEEYIFLFQLHRLHNNNKYALSFAICNLVASKKPQTKLSWAQRAMKKYHIFMCKIEMKLWQSFAFDTISMDPIMFFPRDN